MLDRDRLIEETENAIKWIKDYVKDRGVVLGLSGGKDSATVLAMAVKALGKDKVITVGMPCNSIPEDLNDARLCAEKFGVKFIVTDLSDSYNILEKTVNEALEPENIELNKESKINIKPRMRMLTVYAIAQSYGYFVIGTGNLCEAMVGYTTKWGDSAYDLNPIANFTVDEVLAIGEYLGVPDKIIHKAPNDGLGGQTDEEKMGITYKQIAEYIETGHTDEDAMRKIEQRNKATKHKRVPIPVYEVDRKKYLD